MKNKSEETSTLTVADAKLALVKMLEMTDDGDLKMFLDPLARAVPEFAANGKIVTFGPWKCDLRAHTFVLTVASREILLECAGSFDRQDDGHWLAHVESKTQT